MAVPATFPRFGNLPAELRILVWANALEPRDIPVRIAPAQGPGPKIKSSTNDVEDDPELILSAYLYAYMPRSLVVPGILHACRESRVLFLDRDCYTTIPFFAAVAEPPNPVPRTRTRCHTTHVPSARLRKRPQAQVHARPRWERQAWVNWSIDNICIATEMQHSPAFCMRDLTPFLPVIAQKIQHLTLDYRRLLHLDPEEFRYRWCPHLRGSLKSLTVTVTPAYSPGLRWFTRPMWHTLAPWLNIVETSFYHVVSAMFMDLPREAMTAEYQHWRIGIPKPTPATGPDDEQWAWQIPVRFIEAKSRLVLMETDGRRWSKWGYPEDREGEWLLVYNSQHIPVDSDFL